MQSIKLSKTPNRIKILLRLPALSATEMSVSLNIFCCLVAAALSSCNGQLVPDITDNVDKSWGTPTVEQLQQDLQQCRQSFDTLKNVIGNVIPTGEAEWSDWGPFSECSLSCIPVAGNTTTGTKTRTRTCENAASIFGTGDCPGESTETVSCAPANQDLCPVTVLSPQPQNDIGGTGGWPFTDENEWNNKPITGIRMSCGRVVVSLQLRYGDDWAPVHGGGVSEWCEFLTNYNVTYNFAPGERIVSVNAIYKSYTNSLTFFTNLGAIRKCGISALGTVKKTIQGRRLLYVSGSSGCYIDGLKLHWAQ